MELFWKIANGFKQLTIFAKSFILDVPLGSEYASGLKNLAILKNVLTLPNLYPRVNSDLKVLEDKKKICE